MSNFIRTIKFPFVYEKGQLPAPAMDEAAIQESLRQLILTPRGSRIMRPDFGTNVHMLVFENNTQLLVENMRAEVATAVARYEPRVIVLDIDVQMDDDSLITTIHYAVRVTQERAELSLRIPKG